MNQKIGLRVIAMITLGITATAMLAARSSYVAEGFIGETEKNVVGKAAPVGHVPLAISGDNIYVAWWTNKTGNDEVLFRASTDKGQTFGEKINISDSSDAASTRVEIDSDADSVVVTWWETNQTDDIPVMRVSNDNGKTFGETIFLATNGRIG
jgi:hypothetical protein